MNPPQKNHGILLFFASLSAVLSVCSFFLTARHAENRKTIQSLRQAVDQLNLKLDNHQEEMAMAEYYRFQDNVYRLQEPEFAKITKAVFNLSRKHGFNPYLVMAVIFVESRFDRHAVSKAGACGLMQINYPVWKDELQIDRRRLFQIEYNIELGLTILKGYLAETKGDIVRALILYNNGYNYAGNNYHEKVFASHYMRHAGLG
jgi:soluble lytic murein transglycosylase-like protein